MRAAAAHDIIELEQQKISREKERNLAHSHKKSARAF
jgi:hypothetical protein